MAADAHGDDLHALVAAAAGAEAAGESGITPSVRAAFAAMRLLRDDGYQVVFRHVGFCDCAVARDAERWVGRGEAEVQALLDALHQMFPSRLAWDLLAKRLAVVPPTHVVEEAAVEAPAVPAAIPATPVAVPLAPTPAPIVSKKASAAAALDAVAALRKEIEQSRGPLARLAPARQRLRIQAWMCRARAEQEKQPASADLTRAVALVARELSILCKLYWPGSVRALQSSTTPSAIAPRASTWAEAAAHATAFDRPDASSKLDADGWADGARLLPASPRPEVELHDVVRFVEELTGPLGDSQPRLPVGRLAASAEILVAAAKLRWLRNSRCSVERWAQALGRMRWLATETRDRTLQAQLDPDFVPSSSWADAARKAKR